ncbi:MAG: plasma-rane proton-efflux P-type ATPase [Firmicutes bacterium]|nr:plasma-rane proton-efflux P-type ATPase [Bacillota bacterium]
MIGSQIHSKDTILFDSSPDVVLQALETDLTQGLTTGEVKKRLEQWGYNEVAEPQANPILQLAKKFWGISAWMLELVVVLSWYLHKYSDAVIVAGLLVINAILSYFEERQAERALDDLKNKLKINAKVLRDGQWTVTPATHLVPGDIVRLRGGDFAPADIKLAEGEVRVDQSSLTGESAAVTKTKTENLYSGSVVQRGEATGIVLTIGSFTFFGKTTQLVQSARPKLHIEKIITKVVRRLFMIVVVLLLVMFGMVLYRHLPVVDILPLALIVLLSAVPVALPVMLTVSMAFGAKELVRNGVLVTRLNASEDAAMVDIICVDKTGTITRNKLSVTTVLPHIPFSEDDVLRIGLLASQEADQDPIDMAVIQAAHERGILASSGNLIRFVPFSPESRRTEAHVMENGVAYIAMKGAVEVIVGLCGVSVKQTEEIRRDTSQLAAKGDKVLAFAKVNEEGVYHFAGLVGLNDAPRSDSKELIEQAHSLGISIKMLTGDALLTAQEIARQVGIRGEVVSSKTVRDYLQTDPQQAVELIKTSGGFAEVYPEDKFLIVKALQNAGHVVGMTGDGVNDAPALKQAEVGIAVSNATDVAKEAASVVLTGEGLSGIISLIQIGRTVHRRIQIWVLNKISRTILKSCFVVGTFLATGDFLVSAFAMLLLIFMTDFAKVALATDRVEWSPKPTTLNITSITKTATILGIAMVLEVGGLLYIGIQYFDMSPGGNALNTFSFLALFFFAIFSLFVVRQEGHFWSSKPSAVLSGVILAVVVIAVSVGFFGFSDLQGIGLRPIVCIIVYSFMFSLLLNDFIKLGLTKKI